MSAFLSTGQMMDVLQVGEIAEAYKHFDGKVEKLFEVERTSSFDEPFLIAKTKRPLTINEPLLSLQWRIVPTKSRFAEALKAYGRVYETSSR